MQAISSLSKRAHRVGKATREDFLRSYDGTGSTLVCNEGANVGFKYNVTSAPKSTPAYSFPKSKSLTALALSPGRYARRRTWAPEARGAGDPEGLSRVCGCGGRGLCVCMCLGEM